MKIIDADQLKTMRDQNQDFLLLNTLDESAFQQTKIPGAINIPQSQEDFVEKVEQHAGGKQKPVVVYCANTECQSSREAGEKLDAANFENVYEFEAGAAGWKEAGESLAAG